MSMLNRRKVMTVAAAALAGAARVQAQPLAEAPDHEDRVVTEVQRGDPALAMENLLFNPVKVQQAVLGVTQASYEPRISAIREALVTGASSHLGKNRSNNQDEIERWFNLFDLPFAIDGKPLPFCAAGLSFVAVALYARQSGVANPTTSKLRNFLGDVDRHHFYPTPSVVDMKSVAVGKRRWVTRQNAVQALAPRPGWLVVFDWNRDGHPDHVGLVEALDGSVLKTIEFNTSDTSATNGGSVARRRRTLDTKVQGFIRPELTRLT
jgi:CHAP domain